VVQKNEERSRLVAATASRLRLLQADLADEPADVRQEHLDDVVRASLSKLVPQERDSFLAELEEAFPSWDSNVAVASEGAAVSVMDRKELEDPSFLVARLAELSSGLTDIQRRVLADRLREAGLAPRVQEGGPPWPEESEGKFRTRMQLGEQESVDAGRLMELATLLVEVASSLDQLVWNTWKTVSPRSALKRPAPLSHTMGRFVSGDTEVGRGQVAQDAERLRQLTAALVSAVSQVGRQFAQGHVSKFSPTEIAAMAGLEGGGLLVSKEVKCWRKYVELATSMDEVAIEGQIMQALAAYAESLIKGVGAKS
jgi:hypothetical protein